MSALSEDIKHCSGDSSSKFSESALISIIVPVYKVEKYLPKCIDSLLSQTYSNIEIILVDDGSPDGCGEICDRYGRSDARIKVIHQPNQGVSAARNAGLAKAKGEYIGFCDPDDYVSPDMYGEMLRAIQSSGCDFAACGYNYYDEMYCLDYSRVYEERATEILDLKTLYFHLSDMPPTIRHGVVTKLFKSELIKGLRFNPILRSCEDLDFLCRYIRKVESVVFVHKPLYNNLVRKGSATHGGLDASSLRNSLVIHDRMYRDSMEIAGEYKDHAQAYLLDVCTLKYNEAKDKTESDTDSDVAWMRGYIRREALKAVFNSEINWKTKIYYLLLWIRK